MAEYKFVVDAGYSDLALHSQIGFLEGLFMYFLGTADEVGGFGEAAVGEEKAGVEYAHPCHYYVAVAVEHVHFEFAVADVADVGQL